MRWDLLRWGSGGTGGGGMDAFMEFKSEAKLWDLERGESEGTMGERSVVTIGGGSGGAICGGSVGVTGGGSGGTICGGRSSLPKLIFLSWFSPLWLLLGWLFIMAVAVTRDGEGGWVT